MLGCFSVQSKSLFNVRSAFKLMQHDLDPLLQGELYQSRGCCLLPWMLCHVQHVLEGLTSCKNTCIAGTLQAPEPSQAAQPKAAPEHAAISRDQMRTADRIIVNVLQKVTFPT